MTLVFALVFVVEAGEIDLSFASVVGVAALVFSEFVLVGWNPYLCLVLAILAGGVAGLINGILVAYLGLSALIVTLGMNFFWRGFIQIITNGTGAPLAFLENTSFHNGFVGQASIIPVQMLCAARFAILGIALFSYHKFFAYVRFVGQ